MNLPKQRNPAPPIRFARKHMMTRKMTTTNAMLTDSQINAKIAELCPKLARVLPDGRTVYHNGTPFLPLTDLNACAEMRATLTEEQKHQYANELAKELKRTRILWKDVDGFPMIDATARQHCLTFLRTHGVEVAP